MIVLVATHSLRARRAKSSLKSSLQMELYVMPALVMEALRFSRPTRPGHWPLQLAAVRIGPRWPFRPASTWWLYSQTASATMTGASGWMVAKTSMPIRWFQMKPWPTSGS